ncbi:uncharacterized protein BJ212DRAFT_1298966 [Suillus subaureus]|uniref:Uncharacterized protein n=1 Tax=Suillus subaureus TaxID=48587 RepID=A0A9P7ECZ7_9AGAM|nr:uncharacterized protein BJ212DRAFT_1298966 [Suillus subaureus]KAG1818127.1 hypothetical protein BJ212DRAFT_1298966 [Suillus subaureus]
MEPAIRSRFSDLPLEIALNILNYAVEPTFSQEEKYDDQNPYATALSLCLVSRLVRRITPPKLLHTISLRRSDSVRMFANALLMQKAYAEEKSDLFFDYTSVVQKMWIGASAESEIFVYDLAPEISVLVPVLLAAPALAIDCYYLKLVVQSVEDASSSRADPNVDHGPSPFPGKTQSLTIMGHTTSHMIFQNIRKGSIFLASIPHLIYLIDLPMDSDIFRDISRGLKLTSFLLRPWLCDIPWTCMKSLETFSVVYPHLAEPYKIRSYIDHTRGVDLHVERLTVSAPLYKQDPESFPWMEPPFPVTHPGQKRIHSDGISVEVTNCREHFWRFHYTWDKLWACGITDGAGGQRVL